jgi:cytochrome b involved in lipid metabolism
MVTGNNKVLFIDEINKHFQYMLTLTKNYLKENDRNNLSQYGTKINEHLYIVSKMAKKRPEMAGLIAIYVDKLISQAQSNIRIIKNSKSINENIREKKLTLNKGLMMSVFIPAQNAIKNGFIYDPYDMESLKISKKEISKNNKSKKSWVVL